MADAHQPPAPPSAPPSTAAGETKLPLVALIFGILSLIQCLPLVGGIVAIVTGVIGRKRARELGAKTGSATAGIWLGVLGIVINIVLLIALMATGFAIFGKVSEQAKIAEQLKPAQIAAEAYGASNGTYRGLTLEQLERYGYVPVSDVTVAPFSTNGGNSFCIEGALTSDPGTMIHTPPTAGELRIELNLGGATFVYAVGSCPQT